MRLFFFFLNLWDEIFQQYGPRDEICNGQIHFLSTVHRYFTHGKKVVYTHHFHVNYFEFQITLSIIAEPFRKHVLARQTVPEGKKTGISIPSSTLPPAQGVPLLCWSDGASQGNFSPPGLIKGIKEE